MAVILSLDKKLELARAKKDEVLKKRKILAVQKTFQCARCAIKCEKCGIQISRAHMRNVRKDSKLILPYRFCESCSDEYLDYINWLKGKENPNFYWHNDEWAQCWKSWMDYQGAADRYLKSKEFRQLLEDLKN